MKEEPQPLEFEFDESTSMDDIFGHDDVPSRKQRDPKGKVGGQHSSVNPLELPGEVDMEALLNDDGFDEPNEEPEAAEEPGMPSDIFGSVERESMQGLLDDSSNPDIAEGRIIDIAIAGASVQLPNGRQGFLDKSDFSDWSQVQVGDTVQVSVVDGSGEAQPSLTLLSHEIQTLPARQPTSKARPFDGFKPGTRFVLDASNICRSFSGSSASSLAPLLSLVNGILERDGGCTCVFDANERYVLGENRSERSGVRLYEELLTDLSKMFIEAPATGTADDYLLKIAHRERLAVISNDRFDKASDRHREQYPWLVPGGSRLIRGRVENGRIHIPRLKLSIPLSRDLSSLVQSIKLQGLSNA